MRRWSCVGLAAFWESTALLAILICSSFASAKVINIYYQLPGDVRCCWRLCEVSGRICGSGSAEKPSNALRHSRKSMRSGVKKQTRKKCISMAEMSVPGAADITPWRWQTLLGRWSKSNVAYIRIYSSDGNEERNARVLCRHQPRYRMLMLRLSCRQYLHMLARRTKSVNCCQSANQNRLNFDEFGSSGLHCSHAVATCRAEQSSRCLLVMNGGPLHNERAWMPMLLRSITRRSMMWYLVSI